VDSPHFYRAAAVHDWGLYTTIPHFYRAAAESFYTLPHPFRICPRLRLFTWGCVPHRPRVYPCGNPAWERVDTEEFKVFGL